MTKELGIEAERKVRGWRDLEVFYGKRLHVELKTMRN